MTSQIFKTIVPKDKLFSLLDKICVKNEKYYILNKISYRKAEYLHEIAPFYDSIIQYYYTSKQFYVTRKQSCSSFITVIRQMCKINNINYTSKIIYNKSTYDIVYYIYF